MILTPHPETPSGAVARIDVAVERAQYSLRIRYAATGDVARLSTAPPSNAARADELWRTTCFEAFIRPENGEGYRELNLAPSTQWAAYSFTSYRTGMANTDDLGPPHIETRRGEGSFELIASIPHRLPPGPWRVALSAIIEETFGAKSYWALAHPPGKPDFHHPDGFVCELP
ncbi:MAG: DOMON-like domain-containing protein [Hyphomonadaceae bacterium]